MRDHVLQPAAAERRLHLLAHELRDHAAEHFLAAIAELLEPTVAHVSDAAAAVDGVQHRRRRAIQLAVVLLETRLLRRLRCRRRPCADSRPPRCARRSRSRGSRRARAAGHEIDRHAVETARSPQHRQVLLDDALRGLGAREILRAHVRDLFARVAETAQPRVAGVDEEAVLVQRDEQSRAPAEKPLVVFFLRHAEHLTVFRRSDATKNRYSRNIVNAKLA